MKMFRIWGGKRHHGNNMECYEADDIEGVDEADRCYVAMIIAARTGDMSICKDGVIPKIGFHLHVLGSHVEHIIELEVWR